MLYTWHFYAVACMHCIAFLPCSAHAYWLWHDVQVSSIQHHTYTVLIVCNETDQTNTRGSNNEATSHTINKWCWWLCITKRRAGQSMGAHWHVCMCVHFLYVSCMGPIYIHAALHAGDDSCCLSVKCRGPSLYFCYKWQRNIDYQWLLCA